VGWVFVRCNGINDAPVLAQGIKVVFLGLTIMGHAAMWMAVFADMGASMIVVANWLRLLRK